jgi:hypothetical protein
VSDCAIARSNIELIRDLDEQYEANSDEIRRSFEYHGEIKSFFDLIANRGIAFVTYVRPGACSVLSARADGMLTAVR